MALHRRLPKAAASVALPVASLLGVTAVSALPAHAQTAASAAELTVLSPRSGDAVGSHSFSLDVSFKAISASSPVVSAELWVDGVRWVHQDLATPQVKNVLKFDVDGSSLAAGTHTVLVKVFAANGVFSQTQIQVEAGNNSGVSTSAFGGPEMAFVTPGNGKHVAGTVQISLDAHDRNGQNPYVTFYVDKQFKTLKNYPPYTLDWDTTTVSNGYHTVEATGYLDSTDTSTTCRLRVYVDNPGGNTVRLTEIPDLRKTAKKSQAAVPSAAAVASGVKTPTAADAAQEVLPAPRAAFVASRDVLKPVATADLAAPSASEEFLSVAPAPAVRPAVSAAKTAVAPAVDGLALGALRFTPGDALASALDAHIAVPPGRGLTDARAAAIAPVVASTPAVAANIAAPRMATTAISGRSAVTSVAPSVGGIAAVRRAMAAHSQAAYSIAPARFRNAAPGARLRFAAAAPHAAVRPAPIPFFDKPLQVAFDGEQIAFDVAPRVEAGLPIAPFRQIFEHTGGEVDWVASTQVVHAVNSNREVVIRVGKNVATVNGQNVKMDRAAFVERGRTIVPLSFVGKALDVNVQYDPATGRLQITSK